MIRRDLAKEDIEDRFADLTDWPANLAVQAREISSKNVLITGSLPPLRGSYRPDLVGPEEEIAALYREQVELLAPHIDLLLCETMSSAAEGRAAATAAFSIGKTVWVAWTLHEDRSGRLRSWESIDQAINSIISY